MGGGGVPGASAAQRRPPRPPGLRRGSGSSVSARLTLRGRSSAPGHPRGTPLLAWQGRFPSHPAGAQQHAGAPPGNAPAGLARALPVSPCGGTAAHRSSPQECPCWPGKGAAASPSIAQPAAERGQGWSLLTRTPASDALSRGGQAAPSVMEGKTSSGPRRPLQTPAEGFAHPECLQISLSLHEAAFPQTFTFKSRRHQSSGRC